MSILATANCPHTDTPTLYPQGQAGQWYRLRLGWNVLPLYGVDPDTGDCTCGRRHEPDGRDVGKHPLARALPGGKWEQYSRQQQDSMDLLRWWGEAYGRKWNPKYSNVGVVTGAVSGVVVLDVDGPDGTASLAGRELPVTPTVETGSGGRHYYFAHPGGQVPNKVRVAPGLDVRGDGGYVVAPPSRHRSGRVYRWVDGRRPDQVPPAQMPGWLLDMIHGAGGGAGTRTAAAGGQAREGGGRGGAATPVEHWVRLITEGVPEGQRNDTAARLTGYLLRHGLPPAVVAALMLQWNQANRPPLHDDELLRVVRSIAARDSRRRGVTA